MDQVIKNHKDKIVGRLNISKLKKNPQHVTKVDNFDNNKTVNLNNDEG